MNFEDLLSLLCWKGSRQDENGVYCIIAVAVIF